ncbi:MAG: hypothetical protein Q7R76_00545 [Candidatus Woesearchaeota archaeon]|nr:hypothetical protein [Candidatus Woesearchaeota archaeon]
MAKKCLICNAEAQFCIKGTSDYYCKECAFDQFGDLAYLVKVEDEAQRLKQVVEEVETHKDEELDISINETK